MRALETLFESRPDQIASQQAAREPVVLLEQVAVKGGELSLRHLDLAEDVLRLLHFLTKPHIAVLHARRPLDVVHTVHALKGHGDAFEPVRQLRRDRRQLQTAGLLKVGELGNFEAVEHHLPPDAPCAECR
jgi:hypothetical protein